jgi:membrane fusion protein (multidrug efflux system)
MDAATWQTEAERQSGDGPPRWRKPLAIAAAALVLLAIIGCGVAWWLHARNFESTDDAFVDGYVTQVAPQVAGRVIALQFTDNQHVEAGQVLVQIDPRDFEVKLDQAKAQLAIQQSAFDQARANVRVAEADLVQAKKDYDRFTAIDPHAVSRQQVDNAEATYRAAQAKLDAARQAVDGAQAQMRSSEANVAAAELQLSYCTIVAPVAGRIGHRTVSVGNYVNPGQALFALVQDQVWVTANFKETQLAAMHPGQSVDIAVDAIPSITFHGRIDSLQPGTGSQFSVLPAENATGNYVKIVQRLPVKIAFDDDQARDARLSPGMSVVPYVHVR